MRVLFVTGMHPTAQHPLRGVIIERLARGLEERGHEITFVRIGDGRGVTRYWRARTVVARAVTAGRPDLVHAHFGYAGLAVPRLPVPLVTSFYGDDLNGTSVPSGGVTWKSRGGVLVSQVTACRSRRCIVVSAPMRSRLWLAACRAKTVVIRDAVDPRLFRPLSKLDARARTGLGSRDILVLFPHSATQPNKRVWLAQAAVERLRQWVPEAKLWIVNGKPSDEMPWYYAAADAMIVTSIREGGPSSVKEALACGLPVVSVLVGDVELFADAPDGMVAAAATPDALADALRRALNLSREPRASLLPEGLTLLTAVRQLERVYRQALGEA